MLTEGTVLQDRYRIIRQLGQGGMGAVYEAVDLRLDTTVALKETLFTEERLRRQFEREARLLARLHHPALPRVSDHFAEGGGAFLVMQYIAGEDLAETIAQRRGAFPQEQVALWADQLLDALDYLHTQDPQIIHRDIKPQNLKLTARGQIVLLDFGLAKGQIGEVSRVTTAASIFGYTPNYAPLEQVQGLGTDPRSDIYALAATLYHLLTGAKPPDALSRAAAIVNGQPDPLRRADELNQNVRPAFAEVLRCAMAQNREHRYATAAEMRKAMRAEGEETISVPTEAATVLLPPSRTQLAAAAPTAAVQPTAPVGETTVMHASSAPQKRRVLPWAIAALALVFGGICAGVFYAYEHGRRQAQVNQPVPAPSPVTNIKIADPSPTPPESEASGTAIPKPEKEKMASAITDPKKKPDSSKKNVKTEEQQAAAENRKAEAEARRAERDAAKNAGPKPAPSPPEVSDGSDYNPDPPNHSNNARRQPPGPRMHTFPDGTRVMVTPNGMRVVTFPDGTTRVFGPRQKIKRP